MLNHLYRYGFTQFVCKCSKPNRRTFIRCLCASGLSISRSNANSVTASAYDVIIVGGGHAGTEAAAAAARMGTRTLLVTQKLETIGEMSCNPAFGGIGKGHLMREIDALDGVCARICDLSGVHYRLLNTRKGPAVWGYRAQIDRSLYKSHIQQELKETENLTIRADSVEDLIIERQENCIPNESASKDGNTRKCTGVILKSGGHVYAKSVVLTTGTFLRGEITIGLESRPAGRIGDEPAVGLAKTLDDIGFKLGRLKTGTPPRLARDSIDFSKTVTSQADRPPKPFSFINDKVWIKPEDQLPCFLTYTTGQVAKLIQNNLHLNKTVIKGTTGPRYCPSIESKVIRFGEKNHQVWLEPEGLTSDIMYPQGLSCTMPADIQQQIINSIPGLEKAVIVRPGYGVEYDFVDPRQIQPSLETHAIRNLFFAGQINGTTGYEEAAAQGIMAGINASLRALERGPFTLSRTESYIGVMIDDLTTQGTVEPYRMFTSRAEFRIHLRPDNADLRLTLKGHAIGCIRSAERLSRLKRVQERLSHTIKLLKDFQRTTAQWRREVNLPEEDNFVVRSALNVVGGNFMTIASLAQLFPETFGFLLSEPDIASRAQIEARYKHALEDQIEEIDELRRDEQLALPHDLDYHSLRISDEAKDKLTLVRPSTIAAASRIQGVTPAAILVLLRHAKNIRRSAGSITSGSLASLSGSQG